MAGEDEESSPASRYSLSSRQCERRKAWQEMQGVFRGDNQVLYTEVWSDERMNTVK